MYESMIFLPAPLPYHSKLCKCWCCYSRDIRLSVCLSVRPSVCPSRSDIVLKGTKISSLTENQNLVCLQISGSCRNSKGATPIFFLFPGSRWMAFGLRRAKMHGGLIVRAVIDVGYGGHPTCPFHEILENIVYFLGNYHVKFRHFRTNIM